jgi:alcohol dehydrogenase (cytochrome c)
MTSLAKHLAAAACGLLAFAACASGGGADRPSDEVAAPLAADWASWGRTSNGHNFSPLARINRDTVSGLAPAWRVPLTAGLSMPTPLVQDGVMFLHTAPDTVLALDGATGRELWRHVHAPAGASTMKMGVGLADGRVFAPTSDLHVIALDARTGAKVWDHQIALSPPATDRTVFNLRSAPLIAGDKVIQGVTASAGPGGGFIVALDINTGAEVWRFHTTARPDGPGGSTWNGLPVERRTGGSVWHQGTYDPELNLVYYGSGPTYDTAPLLKPSGAPGVSNEALYTNATVALDADTGELKWHYQHLPNDQWDLDWAFERQIVTVKVDGRDRKAVMTVGKMGLLDALDAATGAYLFSIDAGVQNVISAVDPKTGAKTIDASKLPDPSRPAVFCPGPSGARAWPPSSFNPQTARLILPLTEWCSQFSGEGPGTLLSSPGASLSDADHPAAIADGKMGRLQALDVAGRRTAWIADLEAPIPTSALSTAGGVVFAGDLAPSLKAFDDRDGKLLWSAPLDGAPSSSVITYSVDGVQFVAVVTGFSNFHINAMASRYQRFQRTIGKLPADAPLTRPPQPEPAIHVFALPASD